MRFSRELTRVASSTRPEPGIEDEEKLAEAIDEGLAAIGRFVDSESFKAALAEMWALPAEDRAGFVGDVLLSHDALAERGITVPPGLQIQRSSFGDRRPTLFCVTQAMTGKPFKKLTITFDNPEHG